ncbi:class I SAM-dependent methyltransferase [Streptomyces sp. ISL-100]|uniref:class I SAM-dependent methyltransferase n=1 Tax=Streptomyces sp. ISL-100 TaxID=2819173 RepID=UPI001BE994E5|nr:class I SAM-dependent methyltransferase [Streptomyces sp. ISL-100]MBT2394887.1 class I SAM-dependent methyltransferase [Streptomyces sp. ISL-100]
MTEPSYLAAVRESYDTVAADYVRYVKPPAAMGAPARAMLTAFAELVRTGDRGPVADVGCGPGLVTAHMAALGLSMVGVDLSPKMIKLARDAHPGLPFVVGSMTALGFGNGTLGGILAWYSTHHTPPEWLPMVFAEFRRTLAPGGHLLLGGHVGDENLRPAQAYGHPVSYGSYFLPLARIAELLGQAGLVVTARLEQEPDEPARRPYACLLAGKPVSGEGVDAL